MTELLNKANQTADMLHDDLREAMRRIQEIQRPEGMTRGDRALNLALGRMITQLNSIRNDLNLIV